MIRPENRNILWATILVDELARAGVRHAVISPGSRSTPLAVAFSRDDRFKIHTIIDERAAAFFALGIGKASGMPAVAVCTSGTAAANYFPAIVEASMSNVPLIVMTADRPHELRDSGANQTIDQVKLYGGYVRWFVDVAPPHANPEDKTLRYLRTTVDRAVAYAQAENGGPVHLNVPFEKPLEPVVIEGDVPDAVWKSIGAQGRSSNAHPYPRFAAHLPTVELHKDLFHIESVSAAIKRSPRGLIVVGQNSRLFFYRNSIYTLSQQTGYPILADSLSRCRFNQRNDSDTCVIGGYETFLYGDFARHVHPDLILQFGDLPTGAALLKYLGEQDTAERILISPTGKWLDDAHRINVLVPAGSELTIQSILNDLDTEPDPSWRALFESAEAITWHAVQALCPHEGDVLRSIVDLMPAQRGLFIASSNPVRHLDQFVLPQTKKVMIDANRGASGIDGTVATALGARSKVLVIGDTALYHDLNSLHLIRRLGIPLVIVCINNDGGGIFHRLPIAEYDPPFRDLMVMPHGLTFEHAAKMFDIPYTLANMGEEFRVAFKAALDSGEPHLIEVPSDAAEFERQRRQLIDTVAQRIKEAGILEKFKASSETQS